jgi:hypothetical protein
MRRWVTAALCAGALSFAGAASAAAPSEHAVTFGLFSFVPGSTATHGVVHDAPEYGGIISTGLFCCEVTVTFDRVFNADQLRGSVRGNLIVGGNPFDTIWVGELHGSMSPQGSSGVFTAVEQTFGSGGLVETGRRFVGRWHVSGHADQSLPHVITLEVEGSLFGG